MVLEEEGGERGEGGAGAQGTAWAARLRTPGRRFLGRRFELLWLRPVNRLLREERLRVDLERRDAASHVTVVPPNWRERARRMIVVGAAAHRLSMVVEVSMCALAVDTVRRAGRSHRRVRQRRTGALARNVVVSVGGLVVDDAHLAAVVARRLLLDGGARVRRVALRVGDVGKHPAATLVLVAARPSARGWQEPTAAAVVSLGGGSVRMVRGGGGALLLLPNVAKVGVLHRLASREAVVGVVREELRDELDAVRRAMRQQLVERGALFVWEVEVDLRPARRARAHSAASAGQHATRGAGSWRAWRTCEFECFLSLASVSGGGVPRMLWILLIWSSSFVPGKSGYSESISK